MRKRLIAGLVLGLLVIGLAVPAIFAAEERDETLDNLYEQIHRLRLRIVERRVELGQLTPEEGEEIKNRMEERYQYRLEERFNCPGGGGFGRGAGRGAGQRFRSGSCGNWGQ